MVDAALYEGGFHPSWAGSLRPKELILLMNGIRWREAREWDRVAQLGAWIINALGAKPQLRIRSLLGRERIEHPKWGFESSEEERYENLKEKFLRLKETLDAKERKRGRSTPGTGSKT